jgi:hypothetical protein
MTKKRILGCLRVPPVEYHWSSQLLAIYSRMGQKIARQMQAEEKLKAFLWNQETLRRPVAHKSPRFKPTKVSLSDSK